MPLCLKLSLLHHQRQGGCGRGPTGGGSEGFRQNIKALVATQSGAPKLAFVPSRDHFFVEAVELAGRQIA